jgi:hypothetical protein
MKQQKAYISPLKQILSTVLSEKICARRTIENFLYVVTDTYGTYYLICFRHSDGG